MKKRGKLLLLERDNWRCGIHLGGCGKTLTLDDFTRDHIVPENVGRGYGCRKDVRTMRNYQAMCEICNKKRKDGAFPPTPINKHCPNSCCKWLYIQNHRQTYLVWVNKIKEVEVYNHETVFWTFQVKEMALKHEGQILNQSQGEMRRNMG